MKIHIRKQLNYTQYIKHIKYVKNIELKASFTIEASIIVPIILFTLAGGIHIGFDMFQQSKEIVKIHEELTELNPVKIVRQNSII